MKIYLRRMYKLFWVAIIGIIAIWLFFMLTVHIVMEKDFEIKFTNHMDTAARTDITISKKIEEVDKAIKYLSDRKIYNCPISSPFGQTYDTYGWYTKLLGIQTDLKTINGKTPYDEVQKIGTDMSNRIAVVISETPPGIEFHPSNTNFWVAITLPLVLLFGMVIGFFRGRMPKIKKQTVDRSSPVE